MSTLTKQNEDQRPLKCEDLCSYFESHSKEPDNLRIGVESETFLLTPKTRGALPFTGERGVEATLREMAKRFEWKKIWEGGHVIALKKGKQLISLEPGGQIEYATPPLKSLSEIEKSLREFQLELSSLADEGWFEMEILGFHPTSKLDEMEWVPKSRYAIMKDYLGQKGSMAHEMMMRTAATQVSMDYVGEEDAFRKLRLGLWCSPFISLLCANSPMKEGKPWDEKVPRVQIWENTDPDRSGIPCRFLELDATFQDYLSYAVDTPMFFIVREGQWIPIPSTFREYCEKGYEAYYATLDDFELHLSTLFPEVRMKQFIEFRQADALPVDRSVALAAFWKGLIYSEVSLHDGLRLFEGISINEFLKYRLECAKKGADTALGGKSTAAYTDELLQLAKAGLEDQGDDTQWLTPLGRG